MTIRDLCQICGKRPVAINYYKAGKAHYRSKCDHCNRGWNKSQPLWTLTGYKKKTLCDRCGYTSKYSDQFDVYHTDGNPKNCRFTNLKTVCANCQRVLHKLKLPWRQGDLTPDL